MFDIIAAESSFVPKRQVSPSWLGRQHLDVFIEELSLAFEYNGEQHYRPIEFFGGQEQFNKQCELDQRKQKLCITHGVELIVIPFDMAHSAQVDTIKREILQKNLDFARE